MSRFVLFSVVYYTMCFWLKAMILEESRKIFAKMLFIQTVAQILFVQKMFVCIEVLLADF